MKILKTQVLRGPNRWSNYRNRLIQVRIDLEEMEDFPTDTIEGFCERMKIAFPGMIDHECSEGVKGGFFTRLERGTWLGHVIEHVALEIQSLAGMETGYGRTRGTAFKGIYNMVFAFEIEQAGLFAAQSAFAIVEAIAKNEPYDIASDIEHLKFLRKRHGLGPSTKSIVDEAQRRGIPWQRLGNRSKIQLGYGKNQKQFQATITGNTSSLAVHIASDKDDTKILLAQAGIPVPAGDICRTEEGMHEIINKIGYPIVIKPLNANQGKGAAINVCDAQTAKVAFAAALAFGKYVIIEKYITGDDYRLLVINGKFVAAARRIPAHVVGDGHSSVSELIEQVNAHPDRGEGHESSLTKILVDADTDHQLQKLGYGLDSVPNNSETVYLKSTSNLSTGGTAADATDEIHPQNKFMAERIAKIVGLDICGIDVMAKNIFTPIQENGGAVLEVNAAPGFRMHLAPTIGKPRNVAKAVVDMLYPENTQSTIPLFAVTGTNGKTTTTRLLAHFAKVAGYTPGYTTTDGIYIGDYKIQEGDTTGPVSAGLILRDPTVDFAVLETARGGLLRSGLAFDHCDVGIITNIQEDHLGLSDINTLADLANVKAVVARSVNKNGFAVLNADDFHCVKIAEELDCNIVYFSMEKCNPVLADHLEKGGYGCYVDNGNITSAKGQQVNVIENVSAIPLSQNGNAKFMVANILAAVGGAFAHGFSISDLQQGLRSFIPSYELTPGRMNFFEFSNFKVLVDYAHNPHGMLAMKDYLETVKAKRKIGIIAGVGDRRDNDIVELASIAATMFDHIIIRQEHGLRGRSLDEINKLMVKGIFGAGTGVSYDLAPEETDAIKLALSMAQPGDLIVALSDEHKKVVNIILAAKDNEVQELPVTVAVATPIAS